MGSRDLSRYATLIDSCDPAWREGVADVIATLSVPPDLAYLFDGLRRTRDLLECNRAAFDQLLDAGRSVWRGTDDLLSTIAVIDERVSTWCLPPDDPAMMRMERTSTESGHPLRGKCLQWCPYWANLFTEPERTAAATRQQAYRAISEQVALNLLVLLARRQSKDVLGAYATWASTGLQPEPMRGSDASRILQASVQVRRLSEAAYAPVVDLMAGEFASLGERVEAATRLCAGGVDRGLQPAVSEVNRFLDAFRLLHEAVVEPLSPQPGTTRHQPHTTHRVQLPYGQVRLAHERVLVTEDELDDGSELRQLYAVDPGAKDVEPDLDGATPFAFAIVEPTWDGAYDASATRYVRLETVRLTRAAVRSQSVPSCGPARLNDWQVARLAEALRNPDGHRLSPQVKAVVLAMLATGRDPFASRIPLVAPGAPSPEPRGLHGEGICYLQGRGVWRVGVPAPAFAKHERVAMQEAPTTACLDLPDLLNFDEAVRDPAGARALAAAAAESTRDRLRGETEAWLREVLWDPDARVQQVRALLQRRLLEVSGGDLALALYVTQRPVAHARSVIHYTALSARTIRQRYLDALAPFRVDTALPACEPDAYVGARRVPTAAAVASLVAAMARRVHAAHGVDRVNATAAYAMLGFHLGTAARPLSLRLVQRDGGDGEWLVLPEKGTPYDRRVVFLPAAVRTQLDLYARSLHAHGVRPCESTGLFVRLSRDDRILRPFTAADLGAAMGECGFGLEPYGLRRFVRSDLQDRGVDREDLDALMGHWGALLSPHDPMSMYPPRRLRALAEGAVSDLLADMGYVPLQ